MYERLLGLEFPTDKNIYLVCWTHKKCGNFPKTLHKLLFSTRLYHISVYLIKLFCDKICLLTRSPVWQEPKLISEENGGLYIFSIISHVDGTGDTSYINVIVCCYDGKIAQLMLARDFFVVRAMAAERIFLPTLRGTHWVIFLVNFSWLVGPLSHTLESVAGLEWRHFFEVMCSRTAVIELT